MCGRWQRSSQVRKRSSAACPWACRSRRVSIIRDHVRVRALRRLGTGRFGFGRVGLRLPTSVLASAHWNRSPWAANGLPLLPVAWLCGLAVEPGGDERHGAAGVDQLERRHEVRPIAGVGDRQRSFLRRERLDLDMILAHAEVVTGVGDADAHDRCADRIAPDDLMSGSCSVTHRPKVRVGLQAVLREPVPILPRPWCAPR